MSQKHKITSVSESANALEEQKVKDCKEFNRTLIKLVASSCSEVVGGFFMKCNANWELCSNSSSI